MRGDGQAADMSVHKAQYEVILSGPVLPGFTPDQALAALSRLFDAPVNELNRIFIGGEHPIDHLFSADEALDMQARLEAIGIRASVVRARPDSVPLALKNLPPEQGAAAAGEMASPSRPAPAATPASPRKPSPSRPQQDGQRLATPQHPTQPQAQQHWDAGWQEPLQEEAFQGPDQVALFIGPANEKYRRVFDRFTQRGRSSLPLSWNWGAFVSPFLWAMYRKMWLWGLVIGITEVILPSIALFMGLQGEGPARLVYAGLLAIVANRLFWPMLANYLYFRHVNASLRNLHQMMSYVADVDIASRGGTSRTGVLVGLVFGLVSILFVWSVLDSIHPANAGDGLASRNSVEAATDGRQRPEQSPLAVTQSRLQRLGEALETWVGSKSRSVKNLQILAIEMELPGEYLEDGWGEPVRLLEDPAGYRLLSTGPDRRLATADDVELFVRTRHTPADG